MDRRGPCVVTYAGDCVSSLPRGRVRRYRSWATIVAWTLLSSTAHAQPPQRHAAEGDDAAGEHGGSEHGGSEHGGSEHGGSEHGGSEHGGSEQPASEHDVQTRGAEESGDREHGAHHEAFPNLVGFRAGHLTVSEPREEEAGRTVRTFVFLGLSYERTLIHRWLEAEISVPVAISPGEEVEVAMPFDLHFKIPFHPAPDLSPYIAAGPSLDLVVAPEVKVLYGVSLALGTYVWFSDRIGVDVELDYNLVFEERRAVHELLTAAGPVMRF